MATSSPAVKLVAAAAAALKERSDEVNRLNVFPVPDGDTGTNMSLTMEAVIGELAALDSSATLADICKSITHGSLMGARGNSGVILSQILRGLCEVVGEAQVIDAELVAAALARSVEVSFQAVRKPVEGTMLTVLKDTSIDAAAAVAAGTDLDVLLTRLSAAAFASVKRTPELLPVLKENGVVDAGGFGLAILFEGLVAAFEGKEVHIVEMGGPTSSVLSVMPSDDWDDNEYLYCTEFLLIGQDLDRESVNDYVSSMGGSELVVGSGDTLKIHVHTDHPGAVLAHMTGIGEVAEVHVNNMRRQTAERSAAIKADAAAEVAPKPYGIVTVATGDGIKAILSSLGADTIVSGGQTMNPSTAELLAAAKGVNAETVIILPNNKNIHLAAQQAAEHADFPVGMVPTRTVPEAFTALLEFDPDASLEDNVRAMSEAASRVRTGEVTTAIKDSKAKVGPIVAGQVIGILDDEIEIVGESVADVAIRLVDMMVADADTLTILAGADLGDDEAERIAEAIGNAHPEMDIDSQRGGQPLYPLIIAAE